MAKETNNDNTADENTDLNKALDNLVDKSKADAKAAEEAEAAKKAAEGGDDTPRPGDPPRPDDTTPKPDANGGAFDSLNPSKPDDNKLDESKDSLDEINLSKEASKDDAEQFIKMRRSTREKLKTQDDKIQTLEKQIATGTSNDSEAIKTLTEQNEALSKRLGQLDIKQTPEFKEKILAPREKSIAALQKIWKDNEMDGTLEGLLAKSGKALAASVDEISEKITTGLERSKFVRHIENLEVIGELEQTIVENADVANDALMQNNRNRMDSVFQDRYKAKISTDGRLMDILKVPEKAEPEEIASIKNYNESIDRMEKRAHSIATGDLREEDIADVATMAAIGEHLVHSGIPRLTVEYNSMRRMLGEAVRRLSELEGGSPSPSGGDDGDHSPAPSKTKEYSESEFQGVVKRVVADIKKAR